MCSKQPRRSRLWHPGDQQTPAAKAIPGSAHPWPELAPALRPAACRQGCHGPRRRPRVLPGHPAPLEREREAPGRHIHVFPKPPRCQGCLLRAASTRTSAAASRVQTPRSGLSHVQAKLPPFGTDWQLLRKGAKPALPQAPRRQCSTYLRSSCPSSHRAGDRGSAAWLSLPHELHSPSGTNPAGTHKAAHPLQRRGRR